MILRFLQTVLRFKASSSKQCNKNKFKIQCNQIAANLNSKTKLFTIQMKNSKKMNIQSNLMNETDENQVIIFLFSKPKTPIIHNLQKCKDKPVLLKSLIFNKNPRFNSLNNNHNPIQFVLTLTKGKLIKMKFMIENLKWEI